MTRGRPALLAGVALLGGAWFWVHSWEPAYRQPPRDPATTVVAPTSPDPANLPEECRRTPDFEHGVVVCFPFDPDDR